MNTTRRQQLCEDLVAKWGREAEQSAVARLLADAAAVVAPMAPEDVAKLWNRRVDADVRRTLLRQVAGWTTPQCVAAAVAFAAWYAETTGEYVGWEPALDYITGARRALQQKKVA